MFHRSLSLERPLPAEIPKDPCRADLPHIHPRCGETPPDSVPGCRTLRSVLRRAPRELAPWMYSVEAPDASAEIDDFLHSLRGALKAARPVDMGDFVRKICCQQLVVSGLSPSEQASLLCRAAALGDPVELDSLLKQGLQPNMADYDLRPGCALHMHRPPRSYCLRAIAGKREEQMITIKQQSLFCISPSPKQKVIMTMMFLKARL